MAVKTKNTLTSPGQASAHKQLVDETHAHLKAVALRTYSEQKAQAIDDEWVSQFLPIVQRIARRTATYLRPPLSFEDLVSAGTVGLLKAARDFDASHHAEFKTYAYIRIKGAILDELRGASLLPANINRQIRNALELSRKITEQTGSAPTDDELAEKLGISVDEVHELFENARAQHFISIDGFGQGHLAPGELLPTSDTATPESQLEQAELIDELTDAIAHLDQRHRQIVVLYYQQHLTMKEIADILEITESRVSQLHASALFNLSAKLRKWKDGR